MRVVHLEPLPEWIRTLYRERLPAEISMEWADAGAVLAGADALVTAKQPVTASIVEATGRSLAAILVQGRAPWTVDWDAARATGVPVACHPHRGAIAVAEHTMALMLAVARRIVPGHRGTATAEYAAMGLAPIRTDERTIAFNWLKLPDVQQLYGKTLGLVGMGDIGLEVARRARAFDMTVRYSKRTRLPARVEEALGVSYADCRELLSESDVVSLHAPHTPETEQMIDAAALARMRATAVLINTARGGLVDEVALVSALQAGTIAAAGLDVFVDEPLPAGHPLLDTPNVVLSPHVGGGTGGGQRALVGDVVDNLQRLVRGDPLMHVWPGP